MAAVRELKPEQALVIINTYEPWPLYRVLHRVEETEDGHWRITFYRTA